MARLLANIWSRIFRWRSSPSLSIPDWKDRLERHQKWLSSGKRKGQRLIASGESFVGASLAHANLQNAELLNMNFASAELAGTNFRGAELDGAIFHDADLRRANLEHTSGLSRRSLAGADLSDAKLPEEIKEFPLVDTAKEISDQAQKLTLLVAAACFYSWLTIGSTTDASLVLNAGTASLPLVGVEIPTATFFIVAPALLVALHMYLHLHLQRFWECMAGLPSFFPDGQRLDRRAFSWLLADVVRSGLPRLRTRHVAFGRLGQFLSKVMIWWLVPITLALFFQRNMASQHAGSLGVQICLLCIVLVFTWRCRRIMRKTLARVPQTVMVWWRECLRALVLVGVTGLMVAMLGGWTYLAYSSVDTSSMAFAYEGPEGVIMKTPMHIEYDSGSIKDWLPPLERIAALSLSFGQSRLNANLNSAKLTSVPESWTGEKIEDYARVQGPNLANRNLIRLSAKYAFFVKADFSGSDLKGADFSGADLRMMKYGMYSENVSGWGLLIGPREFALSIRTREGLLLSGIENVDFSHADLRFARLWVYGLNRCNFFRADLRNASIGLNAGSGPRSMIGADLRGAVLMGGNWERTLFYGARLEGADLSGAHGLTTNNLAFVMIDDRTRLPAGFPKPRTIKRPLSEFDAAMLSPSFDESNQKSSDSKSQPDLVEALKGFEAGFAPYQTNEIGGVEK